MKKYETKKIFTERITKDLNALAITIEEGSEVKFSTKKLNNLSIGEYEDMGVSIDGNNLLICTSIDTTLIPLSNIIYIDVDSINTKDKQGNKVVLHFDVNQNYVYVVQGLISKVIKFATIDKEIADTWNKCDLKERFTTRDCSANTVVKYKLVEVEQKKGD